MTPTQELRGLRAAFDAYRNAIETAVRLDEKITLADLEALDVQVDAARVIAESRAVKDGR